MLMLREKKMKDEMNRVILNSLDGYGDNEFAAILLLNDIIFLFPDENQWGDKVTIMLVRCNDLFDKGEDAQEIYVYELSDLYHMWEKDPVWGPMVWCAAKREVMPQTAIVKQMEENGWDLNIFVKIEGAQ